MRSTCRHSAGCDPLHLPCKTPVSKDHSHLHLIAFTVLNQCSNFSVWDALSKTTPWVLL